MVNGEVDAATARAKAAAITPILSRFQARLNTVPNTELALARLQRDVKNAEELSARLSVLHEEALIRESEAGSSGQAAIVVVDPALAPDGKHVLSVYVQCAPYKLREGHWDLRRRDLSLTVINALGAYAPNLSSLVEGVQVITPEDLETCYGFTGGHIFHGELALDQLFTMRPVLDWARYKTPVRGLFLCGSGTHPGNGLTGASGANAAREIIRELR